MGSTNATDALAADPSGNRRSVVIPVTDQEPGHATHVRRHLNDHREQLWAEALLRWRQGEHPRLPDTLKAQQARLNELHRQRDEVAEAVIVRFTETTDGVDEDGPIGFPKLMDYVALQKIEASNGRMALALKMLGFRRVQTEFSRRWVRGSVEWGHSKARRARIDDGFADKRKGETP